MATQSPVPPGGDPGVPPGVSVPDMRTPDTAEDEHAELVRLRAEIQDLRSGRGAGAGQAMPGSGRRARGRWRTPVAVLAITIGCVLAPVSVLSFWAANQVSNTDRYVANMAPLIEQPPVQHALSAKITSVITSRLDVKALAEQGSAELTGDHLPRLSALLQNFAGPISNAVNSFVGSAVAKSVASPAMARLWVTANRVAHAGIVRVLSGQGNGSLSLVNGEVVLQLGPLINQVKQALIAQGISFAAKLPAVSATFPLFAAPNLSKAQQGYRLLTALKWALPLLSLALLAAGIWIARSTRRGLLAAALGLSGSMLVLAAALAIARAVYLNSVPQSVLPADAAAVLYDTLVRFIREGLRVLLLIGLVVAAGAFITGPSAAAVGTRRSVKSGIGWLRARAEHAGLRTGPVSTWTGAHKTALRVGAVVLVALIFVFWGQPTLALVIWLVVALLAALALIELVGGREARPAAVPD